MSLPQSRRLDFTEVPCIDVSTLTGGAAAADTVDALDRACRDVGFFYVTGHGVAPDLVAELRDLAVQYFRQPAAVKSGLPLDARMRGYLPLDYASYPGEKRAAKSRQEGFWVGHDRELDRDNPLDGPNRWPEEPSGLKPVMTTYFAEVERLATALQRAFALALGQEDDFFRRLFDPPQSLLKLNHYPPQANPTSLSHIGVVPHSDSGGFTILWQDENGGLEVQTKSGDWVGAPPIPDTFVINIGNVMQIWTGGRFSSTPHRVINRGNVDRYSIPLFVNPAVSAPIMPLFREDGTPAHVPDRPPRYTDYQRREWRRAFPVAGIA